VSGIDLLMTNLLAGIFSHIFEENISVLWGFFTRRCTWYVNFITIIETYQSLHFFAINCWSYWFGFALVATGHRLSDSSECTLLFLAFLFREQFVKPVAMIAVVVYLFWNSAGGRQMRIAISISSKQKPVYLMQWRVFMYLLYESRLKTNL
jgi:hypothetical protein